MSTTARRPILGAVVAALVVTALVVTALVVAAVALSPTAGRRATSAGPVPVSAADTVRYRPAGPLTLLGPATARTGTKIALTGTVVVKAKKPRRVVLSELAAGRWRPLGSTTSTRRGAYTFRVPAGTAARTRVLRADAPAARGVRAVRSPVLRIAVTASAASHLEADDWTYLFGPAGSRWDPCTTIRWAYNPLEQPYAGALADVTQAFAKIAAVSGLNFTYAGTTAYRQLVTTGNSSFNAFPDDVADIVVSWATDVEAPVLANDVVGVGGGQATGTAPGSDVTYRMVLGYLTLDAGATLPAGFDGSGWGQIMMHEVLHALGLNHARWYSTQLMWPTATAANYQFGQGDITGMQRIGQPAGCLS